MNRWTRISGVLGLSLLATPWVYASLGNPDPEGLRAGQSGPEMAAENPGQSGFWTPLDGETANRLTAAGTGELILTEFMYDPAAVEDTGAGDWGLGEWLEVYNPTASDVDLDGWRLVRDLPDGSATKEEVISGSHIVPAGGYFLLASQSNLGDDDFGITADYVWSDAGTNDSFFMRQDDNRISLFDDGDVLVSRVVFDEAAGEGTVEGFSYQLTGTLLDEVYVERSDTWCAANAVIGTVGSDYGTPGAVNDGCSGVDVDGDGYFTVEEDCDDGDDTVYIGATEILDDSKDNDCDGITDGELVPFHVDSPSDSTAPVAHEAELYNFAATWDEESLLVEFEFELSPTQNAVIWYFEMGVDGGEDEFKNDRADDNGNFYGGGNPANGAYPTDIQHDLGVDFMIAAYADGALQVYKVADNLTADSTVGATYANRVPVLGSDRELGQVLFPWENIYFDAGLPSAVPANLQIKVVGITRQFDNEAPFDYLPNNDSNLPVDTYLTLHVDVDGDGEADAIYEDMDEDGFTILQGDCNDRQATVHPGADEICDGLDNDCDGDIDTADADGLSDIPDCELTDGVCSGAVKSEALCQDGAWLACGATEYGASFEADDESSCDVLDNDCDGQSDESLLNTYYLDDDGDGSGDAANTTEACSVPGGHVENGDDCADNDPAIPGAEEILCNGLDDDCDPLTLDAPDIDGDGHDICDADDAGDGDGFAADCQDDDASVNHGASEITCNGKDDDCDGATTDSHDIDGDGHDICGAEDIVNPDDNDLDCDDGAADTYPGASEYCDGVDSDCDGDVDEAAGILADDLQDCELDEGVCSDTTKGADLCVDGAWQSCRAAEYGGSYQAEESACDAQDNDCDGQADEDLLTTYYYDDDGDGYGVISSPFESCVLPEDYAEQAGDCDDTNPALNPETVWYIDFDDDGYGVDSGFTTVQCAQPTGNYQLNADDCDDGDEDINPGANEVCNNTNDDCDANIDEGFDVDGDGFYDCPSQGLAVDCNDGDEDIYPGATEVCDGADSDCDGESDEIEFDQDEDGHIDSEASCPGSSINGKDIDDCDDDDDTVFAGAEELCDLKDNDCDGEFDEGDGVLVTYYLDSDGDGFGDGAVSQEACGAPNGYVDIAGDCDDDDDVVYPGADELCDDKDNDCNGEIDDGALNTYYLDDDNDGYGDCAESVEACSVPANYVEICDDCDDSNAAINPDTVWYLDGDGDGFGRDNITQVVCEAPDGFVDNDEDCNDVNPDVYPAASEACNDIDDDCDSQSDEGFDEDGDGYYQCVHNGKLTDCDDDDNQVNPAETEVCDGKDNDCNGVGDDSVFDVDGDGHIDADAACSVSEVAGKPVDDCNDDDDTIFTGATEVCDGKDNNCDGEGDLTTFDKDGDGQLVEGQSCPENLAKAPTDCNDNDAEIGLDFEEVCDGKDNDCDGRGDATDGFDIDGDGSLAEACCASGYVDACDCDDDDDTRGHDITEICDEIDNDCDGTADEGTLVDGDGDGQAACQGDCDDSAAHIFIGADEVCDGKDSNCDGDKLETEVDADGDGFINCDNVITGMDGDCDDSEAFTYPEADERCDLEDNDCDSVIDEGAKTTYYADVDEDGYGDDDITEAACEAPVGYVERGGDCDDDDDERVPGGTEICDAKDNDCGESDGDPNIDEGFDLDGIGGADCTDDDGDGFTEAQQDCNDDDPSIYVGAPEEPEVGSNEGDALDNDCDGIVDEGTLRYDDDGDGYCEAFGGPDGDCEGVINEGECDDDDEEVNPGAEEICDDGIDQDCSGADLPCDQFDYDLDGFVENPIDGSSADCDDGKACDPEADDFEACIAAAAAINPAAEEIAGNYIDENCDDYVFDVDGDGFGTADGDCDDLAFSVNPDADEVPGDARDENCDGIVEDIDFDGQNDIEIGGDDCNDGAECLDLEDQETIDACLALASTIYDGADEVCGDGIDQDCSGEDLPCLYVDNDGDGFPEITGDGSPGDCDDGEACAVIDDPEAQAECYATAAAVNPDADEIPGNDVDEDCSGVANDKDGDGQDDVENGGEDCDDLTATTFDGADEIHPDDGIDNVDNDCDGLVDEGTIRFDDDGDGFCEALAGPTNTCVGEAEPGDCDDADDTIYPESEHFIYDDGIDQNCDGEDEVSGEVDLDGDGYLGGVDCNDDPDNGGIDDYPGAPELCSDDRDNNCNNVVNETCREPVFFGACSTSGTDGANSWLAMLALLLPTFILRRRRSH